MDSCPHCGVFRNRGSLFSEVPLYLNFPFANQAITLQKTPFVVPTLYGYIPLATSARFLALKKTTFQFSTASYEFFMKPEISAEYHLVGGVLAGDNLMNLMVDYTASHCFVVLVLRLCERRPCSSFHMAWVAMGLLLHILCSVYIVPS